MRAGPTTAPGTGASTPSLAWWPAPTTPRASQHATPLWDGAPGRPPSSGTQSADRPRGRHWPTAQLSTPLTSTTTTFQPPATRVRSYSPPCSRSARSVEPRVGLYLTPTSWGLRCNYAWVRPSTCRTSIRVSTQRPQSEHWQLRLPAHASSASTPLPPVTPFPLLRVWRLDQNPNSARRPSTCTPGWRPTTAS